MDDDDEFRARVAGNVDETQVGRAGWLWLTRPDGWIDEVARIQDEADATAAATAAERSERNARRKLKAARAAVDKAEAKARARTEELEQLRAELAEERARRSAAETERASLDAEVRRLGEERSRAVRELESAEARLADQAASASKTQVRARELAPERTRQGPSDEGVHDGVHTVVRDMFHDVIDQLLRADEETLPTPRDERSSRATTLVPVDRSALADAMRALADAASMLSDPLSRLAASLAQPGTDPRSTSDPTTGDARAPQRSIDEASAATTDAASSGSQTVVGARQPVRLPRGIMADSVEAALLLMRTPSALVLVDGYNVTMNGWPDLPIAEQRARLLSALDETAARNGADVEVVFDGADVEPAVAALHTGHRGVRKRFSPPDVEADDVLLGILGQTPTNRPVVVVSSDNRVREGARRRGANVVHPRQLLDVLRR